MKTENLKIEKHHRKNSEEAKAILDGIKRYNSRYSSYGSFKEFTITFKNPRGKVVAGVNGSSNWGWTFIKLLWVAERYRDRGLGLKLMQAAHAEAKARRSKNIWLDTFAFQAPKFYEKLGYRKFGELKDYPKGYRRYFYTKRLAK